MGSSSTPTMSDWSTTPGNNDTAGDITFAEGQTPSSLNDSARQLMADVRTWYESAEWIEYGHTPVYVSAGSFTIATDVTSIYHVGRRLKLYGSSMGTVYATITASSYGAPNTTITVARDSGSLGATLSRVWYSSPSFSNSSLFQTGTLTLTFTASSGSFGTINYNSDRSGYYLRFGPICYIYARIATDTLAVGTASSTLRISGAAFGAASNTSLAVSSASGFNPGAGESQPISAYITSGGNIILQNMTLATGAINAMAASEVTTGSNTGYNDVIVSGFYQVA